MIKNMTTEKQLTEITVKPSESEETIMNVIAKLQVIPEKKWCIDQQENSIGQSCFLGHVARFSDYLGYELNDKFYREFNTKLHVINNGVESEQRDNKDDDYKNRYITAMNSFPEIMSLPTPKQRTLAGLRLLLQKELEK